MDTTVRPVTISVIVATFGDGWWSRLARRRAVPSVCAQTVRPLELIRHHRDDGTLHEVRNEAADQAAGDWLCVLDADDELDPGYLAAMTEAARTEQTTPDGEPVPPCALLVPAVAYVRGPGDEDAPAMLKPNAPITEVNRAVIGTLVPRHLFQTIGGFGDWPIYEDWSAWLSCIEHGAELVDVPAAIYRAWERPGSRNRQPRAVQAATYDRIRAFHRLS